VDAQGWTAADQEIYEQVRDRPLILVVNKVDLGEKLTGMPEVLTVRTIAAQGQGITELEQAILQIANAGRIEAANLDMAINQRQAAALMRARSSLENVAGAIAEQLPLDFWTIDLRSAIQALGEITGEELTESVLDQIFSRFCIGK
jgi:tRNA modification GTPase